MEICALLGCYAMCSGKSSPTFRQNYSSHIQGVKVGPIGCPETSVRIHYYMCNNPEERKSHQHRGGSLKSHICLIFRINSCN